MRLGSSKTPGAKHPLHHFLRTLRRNRREVSMSRVLVAVVLAAALSGCSERPTEPKMSPGRPNFATDPGGSGPPTPRSFGPDSYRTGVFTGTGTTAPGLN